jgi:hypothetical protein
MEEEETVDSKELEVRVGPLQVMGILVLLLEVGEVVELVSTILIELEAPAVQEELSSPTLSQ